MNSFIHLTNTRQLIVLVHMIIIFLVRRITLFFNESVLFTLVTRRLIDPLHEERFRILSWSWKDFDQSSPCRDDYDRAESTIMQITALDRVTQRHVLLVEDIDCAVLSILRCPTSSILLWLLVSMTLSASWFSSWLGLLRDRVSKKYKQNILSQFFAIFLKNIMKHLFNEIFHKREMNNLEDTLWYISTLWRERVNINELPWIFFHNLFVPFIIYSVRKRNYSMQIVKPSSYILSFALVFIVPVSALDARIIS